MYFVQVLQDQWMMEPYTTLASSIVFTIVKGSSHGPIGLISLMFSLHLRLMVLRTSSFVRWSKQEMPYINCGNMTSQMLACISGVRLWCCPSMHSRISSFQSQANDLKYN